MTSHTSEIVRLDQLVIDAPDRQRKLRERHVEKIAREFNANALGQPTVSRRPDGTLVLLDGQHRREAMLRRLARGLPTPHTLECRVFTGLSPEEEARLFLTLNTASAPQPLDKWFPRLAAGDDALVKQIAEALDKWNWKVDGHPGQGHILAVGALEQIAREGALLATKMGMDLNLVDLTLQVVTDAWGYETAGVKGDILRGVAALIAERPLVNLKRLTATMKRYTGGPVGLLRSARANASIRKSSTAMSVADMLVIEYNTGLAAASGNKLDDWKRRR